MGALKSFFGLSGSIYAVIYLAFFASEQAGHSVHSVHSVHSGGGNSLKSTLVIIFGCSNSLGRMAAVRGKDARYSSN